MPRHSNISIFVPHIGCPNMCSFCNQRHITGTSNIPKKEDIDSAVAVALKSKNYDPENSEIAFFGGSFTAINRDYMLYLLSTAYKYVENKSVAGIRVSTRPDAINREVLGILKEYGVTSVELGAQSMVDSVLLSNNRGHSAEDVKNASKLIKDFGFSLGLQMMTGLYKDTEDYDIFTAKELIALKPDTIRIYPTIILKDTLLCDKYYSGELVPQSVDSAAELCAKLFIMFNKQNIKVIRLGLHSIDESSYAAGPWHPAFSEICQSKIMLEKITDKLTVKGKYIIFVNPSFLSKTIGQKRININYLKNKGYDCLVKSDSSLKDYEIKIERCG